MAESEKPTEDTCPVCGAKVNPDIATCPGCGNVFRKDKGTWDWKLLADKKKRTRRKDGSENRGHTTDSSEHDPPRSHSAPSTHPQSHLPEQVAESLLEALNDYEKDRSRRRAGILRDVLYATPRPGQPDWIDCIDFERSGTFHSSLPRQYVLTLKDGTIIGRGLFGEVPGKDPPGPNGRATWRVWRVVWVEDRLRCLRCFHEWTPTTRVPEQCNWCFGVLSHLPSRTTTDREDHSP